MKTVLHVITGLGSGGAERMLTRVATYPSKNRQIVVSLMDEGLYGAQLREAGVEVVCLGLPPGRLTFTAVWRLMRTIRRVRPDTVMTWLYHADLLGTVAAWAAGCRGVIWNLRCSDMDFSAYRASTRIVVRLLAAISPLPLAVATNSHAGRRIHEALGYRPRRWIYLPNGFDLDEWRPDEKDRAAVRKELGFDNGVVAYCAVARADPQKDHDTLLCAFATVCKLDTRAHLVLIGRGTRELSLPADVAPRITVLGERKDVPRLLRGMDALVLSSAYGEGFPNAVGEAMATGLPCVVTRVGDAAELVGDTGFTVPARDPRALANAMVMVEADRQNLGARARSRAAGNWGIKSICLLYAVAFAGGGGGIGGIGAPVPPP